MKSILVVGATGLVGKAVLARALADPRIGSVVAPTRRALDPHPKLNNPVVDFDDLPADAGWWKTDAVICCLGTTIRQAGSQEAFRKVDFEYPLTVAGLARDHGVPAFCLVSSVGADAGSKVFYSRTKGEIENAIREVGFPSLTIVRPSVLVGDREEFRIGEKLAAFVFRIAPKRYRPVSGERVAASLLAAAIEAPPGSRIIASENL